jgi:sec-independent protein translocase protein TatA
MVHVVVAEIMGWEFLLVLGIIALLFGSSQIPKLARSIGQASKEFRHGLDAEDVDETPKSDDHT